ncbi:MULTISPECIES: YjbH domain-containing protein [unclassified Vibrio]|uniref:YjbH domain-containing protein n=1 Tax=Vibrio sp. HB236076 TaxID=3232307 RepID=A0AB39HGJ9_9VIBR|nr:YjbH domain-containing protein [Vibrio sp. HB161653]MDP5255277.1 YjbH domain-containing protein [Vibrio sp. HB161653]
MKKHTASSWRLSLLSLSVLASLTPKVMADSFSGPVLTHSQSDFGGVGLMQMPSARMMEQGEFTFNVTNNDDYINYAVSLQVFPWLESTIRYTQVHDLLYSDDASFSGDTDYTDKSIDIKARLLEESFWLPQVSLGFRDIGGTGLFDSEFIAANKRLGPLDFTLGIGWGYIGNSGNLFGKTSGSSDCERDSAFESEGGSIELGRMFTGCTAVFGGLEYQTPWQPLVLKLEYDGNDYQSDFPVTEGDISMPVDSHWNVGAVYALTDWAKIRLSYERGNTLTAGLSMGTNLANLRSVWIDDKAPSYQETAPVDQLTDEQWVQLTQDINDIAGYKQTSVYQKEDVVTVVGEAKKYRDRREGEERVATLIANTGLSAKTYRVVEVSDKQSVAQTDIDAHTFKRVAQVDYPNARFDDARFPTEAKEVDGELKAQSIDDLDYGLSPSLKQTFGSAEGFYLYAIGMNASASYWLNDHFIASGSLYGNIENNYDKFTYTVPPDGTSVKRVRTLARQYLDPRVSLSNLQLTYLDRLSDNVYFQAYGGYLESMFAGAGSEILYRPLQSNWAFGVDANYVKQRNPNSFFGLYEQEWHYDAETNQNYQVQTGGFTGQATLYWQPEFSGLFDNSLLQLKAGQYLAGDKGVTVDFSKQFDSGVIAGVYATKTNLSAEEYGEGSFTKGFYLSIPMDILMVKPSTSRLKFSWQPLTRDGGQMLNRKYELYDVTDPRSPWYSRAIPDSRLP